MSFQIWACGSNGSYQLGLGNDADHEILQIVPLESSMSGSPPLFAFGGNHTFILYSTGELFAAGDNEYGQCGVESPQILKTFIRVPGNWKFVAAGWQFSVLCSSDNKLYSCGYGPKGELGLGENRTHAVSLSEISISNSPEIDEIKCSINHTVVRLKSGKFIGWGVSRKGQLGPAELVISKSGKLKPTPSIWNPRFLPFENVASFCLGRDRTVLVGDTIKVIGVGAEEIDVDADKVCAMWSSIHYTKISEKVGDQGCEGVSFISQIHSVGNNSHGQCLDWKNSENIRYFTVGSEHGLALLGNKVCAWGWGEHGNCGPMKNGNVTFDYLNELYTGIDEVVKIAGGLATSWVVVRKEKNEM